MNTASYALPRATGFDREFGSILGKIRGEDNKIESPSGDIGAWQTLKSRTETSIYLHVEEFDDDHFCLGR